MKNIFGGYSENLLEKSSRLTDSNQFSQILCIFQKKIYNSIIMYIYIYICIYNRFSNTNYIQNAIFGALGSQGGWGFVDDLRGVYPGVQGVPRDPREGFPSGSQGGAQGSQAVEGLNDPNGPQGPQ